MAAALPAKLKSAGIQPFANRAAQLEKYRPIVTYWCEYYILQQILSKQLHLGDDETQSYAVHLMDKLESTKSSNPTNDAIIDDVVAKAYIENFALETFNRGNEAQRTNKVTKQTADTFQAAATFIEILTVWSPLDAGMAAKSKFAKYHALRIAKAIKAGEDPNAKNPVVEEPAVPKVEEDGVEEELRALAGEQNGTTGGCGYRQPTVEDGADVNARPYPERASSEVRQTMPQEPQDGEEHQVSPIEPPDSHDVGDSGNARQGSIGGGYFPSVPSAPAQDVPMDDAFIPPQQPPVIPSQPTTQQQQQSDDAAADFYSNPAHLSSPTDSDGRPHAPPPEQRTVQPPGDPPMQSPGSFGAPSATFAPPTPAPAPAAQPPSASYQPVAHSFQQLPMQPPPLPQPVLQQIPSGVGESYKTDDESVLAAQKHAKWAISALNFEDVGTAVKELRIALQSLGAR